MAFSFGGQNQTGFGAATTTSGFGFGGGLGAALPAATTGTAAQTGGLFSGLATATTSAPAAGIGFGTGTSSFGTGTSSFGTTGTGTTGGLFGAPSTGFGVAAAGASTGATGGLFGTSTSTAGGLGIGSKPMFGAASGTSTFGLGSTFGATQPQQQQQLQQQQQTNTVQNVNNMIKAVSVPHIFGDERDAIIAKWNQLQAFWGTGKGYYSRQAEFVNFVPDNLFCRFKAVGYSCVPKTKNEDGLLGFIFNKKLADIKNNQQQVVDAIQQLVASGNATLSICVEDVKALPENKTEMIVYLQERAPTGMTRHLPSLDVYKAITGNASMTQQLNAKLSVENILPKISFDKDQLKQYLDNPPAGIDGRIWQQAKLDNPDPERFIPVPMIGFTELHNRLRQQEQQTSLHQKRLDIIASDIAALQRNHGDMLSKIEEYKRRYLELSHRVLQVMVKQEVFRRMGYVIQADEEQLRTQLEIIQAELNAPTRFKGRLNELMSQLRMQNQLGGMRCEASYNMEAPVQQEIRQHLKQQQDGIQHLIGVIKEDLDDLKVIETGLSDAGRLQRV